jgi:hypothetical protein
MLINNAFHFLFFSVDIGHILFRLGNPNPNPNSNPNPNTHQPTNQNHQTNALMKSQYQPYVVVSTVSSRDYVRTQELTKWAPTLLERAARLKTADGGFGRVPIVSLSVPFERALRKVHASGPKKYSRFISANPRHQSGLPNLFRESLQVLSLVRCFTLGELGQSYTIGKEEVWFFSPPPFFSLFPLFFSSHRAPTPWQRHGFVSAPLLFHMHI